MAYAGDDGRPVRRSVRELVQRISSSRALPQLTTPISFPGPRQVGGGVEQSQPSHTNTERSSSDAVSRSAYSRPNDALLRYLQPQQQTSSSASRFREQHSAEEELRCRFPSMFSRRQVSSTPSNTVSGSVDETPCGSVITTPSEGGRGCRVSTRYTPYNYQPRRGYGPSRSSRPLPFRPRCESPKLFMRNVFLIDAGENKVPRGPFRQDLYDNKCVIDFFEFSTSWSEERVVEELERAFENILPVGVPSPR